MQHMRLTSLKSFGLIVIGLVVVFVSVWSSVRKRDHCLAVVTRTIRGILIVDIETATSRLVQWPPGSPDTVTLFDIAPVGWSVDGESLIMIEKFGEQNGLYSINLDMGTVQEIAGVPFARVALSPDRATLAFVDLQEPIQAQTSGISPLKLKLLDFNTKEVTDLLDIDLDLSGIYFLWSPDSQQLAVFAQLGDTQWTSFTVDVATSEQQHLVASEGTIAFFLEFTGWSTKRRLNCPGSRQRRAACSSNHRCRRKDNLTEYS